VADKIKAGPNGLLLFDPAGHAPLVGRNSSSPS